MNFILFEFVLVEEGVELLEVFDVFEGNEIDEELDNNSFIFFGRGKCC